MSKANAAGHILSMEEAKERGRKGGKASVQARRKKKSMREIARVILGLIVEPTEETSDLLRGMETDVQTVAIAAQAKQAIEGNLKALEFLRDTAAEMPLKEAPKDNPFERGLEDELDMYAPPPSGLIET